MTTAVLTEWLKAVHDRRAGHEIDQRFGVWLHRMSRGQERLENKVDLLGDAWAHSFTISSRWVAHQPLF